MSLIDPRISALGEQNYAKLRELQEQLKTLDPCSQEYYRVAGESCKLDHGLICGCSECRTFLRLEYRPGVDYSELF